jgi:hypothetical protein
MSRPAEAAARHFSGSPIAEPPPLSVAEDDADVAAEVELDAGAGAELEVAAALDDDGESLLPPQPVSASPAAAMTVSAPNRLVMCFPSTIVFETLWHDPMPGVRGGA